MWATPKTSSPSATWGPSETVFSSLGALVFLGAYYIRLLAGSSIVFYTVLVLKVAPDIQYKVSRT